MLAFWYHSESSGLINKLKKCMQIVRVINLLDLFMQDNLYLCQVAMVTTTMARW